MFAKLFQDLLFALRFRNVSDKKAQIGNTDINFQCLPLFDLVIVELWNETCQKSMKHIIFTDLCQVHLVSFHQTSHLQKM